MLHEKTRDLAAGPNFATISTLMPDGTPQTHVMWVDADGEHVLVNTEVHRTKYRNLARDPRATVTILDREDPYSYVEVRGRLVSEVRGPQARDHIDELSRKYLGRDYPNPITSERVILVIRPEREVVH